MTASINMLNANNSRKVTYQHISDEFLASHRGYKMNTDKFSLLTLVICLIFLALSSEPTLANPVYVNAMIDANFPTSPTQIEADSAFGSILNLTNILDDRGLNGTIFVTPEMATNQSLLVTTLGMRVSHELAAKVTDQSFGSMPVLEQEAYLKQAKKSIDSDRICEGPSANTVNTRGFMLPSGQNDSVYKILDTMGALYEAKFNQGIDQQQAHDKDARPYRMVNHSLYVIPISSYLSNGERILLSDRYVKEEKRLSGSQWYDILVGRFDQSVRDEVPMIVIFNSTISGAGDYLDTYRKFINYAGTKNAHFVSTIQLVNDTMANDPSDKSQIVTARPECPECDKRRA